GDLPGRGKACSCHSAIVGKECAREAWVRPVGAERHARLTGDRGDGERDRTVKGKVDLEGKRLRRLIGVGGRAPGDPELGVDTGQVGGRETNAWCERDLGGAGDLEGSRFLESRNARQPEHERRIAPPHGDRVCRDVGDTWNTETSGQLQTCSIDGHLENRAAQRLRIGSARDLQRLGREYRPALVDLLDALIPLPRFESHRVGNHQEWPEDLLLGPPQLADLATYALGPALAFPD